MAVVQLGLNDWCWICDIISKWDIDDSISNVGVRSIADIWEVGGIWGATLLLLVQVLPFQEILDFHLDYLLMMLSFIFKRALVFTSLITSLCFFLDSLSCQ